MTTDLLSPADVTERYGISGSHLNLLVSEGRVTPAFDPGKPGLARFYTAEEIEKYLASRDPRGRKHPDPNGGAE